jgi:hypothetical protein
MIGIKDIWEKSEELTEQLVEQSPVILKHLKKVLLFAVCSVIFAGLLIIAGFVGLIIKINERINPKKTPIHTEEAEEVEEHSDFSSKENETQIEKMRKDGLM